MAILGCYVSEIFPTPNTNHNSSMPIFAAYATARSTTSVSTALIKILLQPIFTAWAAWRKTMVSPSSWLHGDIPLLSTGIELIMSPLQELIICTPWIWMSATHVARKVNNSILLFSLRRKPLQFPGMVQFGKIRRGTPWPCASLVLCLRLSGR